ncbi:MAG: LysM peptidoglycan-binding domain-containing protein [Anaerolineaceae bacterium]|nr:LysM peptidoglycan-binding domain-containing protein [Anaerolineaceae bacterium]
MTSKKRITLRQFVFLFALMALVFPAAQVAAQVGTAAYINTGRLNVRSGPGVAFGVVVSVPANTEVTLVGRAVSSSWVQVVLADGTQGWVNSLYLRTFANITALPITYNQVVPPPSQPTTGTGVRLHTVQAGETLQTIAARYGTTWQVLAAVNGLVNPNFVYTGQQLTISTVFSATTPTTTPATGGPLVHTVQAGETLQTIAAQYGTTWEVLAAVNGLVNPNFVYTGQLLTISTVSPTTAATYHTVLVGEDLFRIALQYGVTVQALAAANGIYNINLIYPNQRLIIP